MKRPMLLVGVAVLIIVAIFMIEGSKLDVKMKPMTGGDNARVGLKTSQFRAVPELVGIDGYINVENISISDHIGENIVLIDFWTYSCINCQRTLPFLNSMHEKYRDEGLVIIGVHTPEFGFEKDYDNLVEAVEKHGIKYAVVQDNSYATWQAFQNRYWPRKYLVDVDGFIVYDHIGEGGYEETEDKIKELLEERNGV